MCKLKIEDALIQIKISHRLRDRLLFRLLQRLLEATRQCIAARLLGLNRLFEESLASTRLLGENARCFGQLRLVATLRLLMRDNTPEVRVYNEHCTAARTFDLELAFQLGHAHYSSWWLVVGGW